MASQGNSNRAHIMFRYAVVTAGIVLFALLIVIKLFDTTIVHASDWNARANEELKQPKVIDPIRGDILAADGSVLATNIVYYTLRMDYRADGFKEEDFLKDVPALADSLARHFPYRTKKEWEKRLTKELDTPREKRNRWFPLISNLTLEEKNLCHTFPFLSITNPNKNGLVDEMVYLRDKPYGDMARRSIGSIGMTDKCNERHGISGLEKSLDSLLYGRAGVYKRVALTKKIGKWADIPAINGYTVLSTIDITLQDLLEEELNAMLDSADAEWGTAILMDVPTGDIKAMANLEYDAKKDRYVEAYNRAVVAYEPGSVVKTISMLIALEDGLVSDPDEVFQIGSSFTYGSPIRDSHHIGSATVEGILEQSSNIGMTKIIIRGYDGRTQAFVDRLGSLGLFEKMNSGIAEEERVRVTPTRGKRDLANISFGYSSAIPPLYTLSVYNAIANDGRYVRPRLVRGLRNENGDSMLEPTYIRDRICSPENAAKLRRMLKAVVHGSHGTARFIKNDLVPLAGKTGTANHWDTVTHRYDKSRNRLAFCGFFPADSPRYSMMVLTFNPKGAYRSPARSSGRVFRNMALKMYSRGLLGDISDYTDNAPASPPGAVALPGSRPDPEALGGATVKVLAAPSDDAERPTVKNLSLRQAVVALENLGYKVTFTGTGRVVGESIDPATRTAQLTLSTRY